jgi:single-strand DNA-binding protein
MSNGVNRVHVIGHLGSDPELKTTTNGNAVANFSVATTEKWNDKSGQKQERTEWHRIVCWGKTAELCGKYLSKGRQIYLEGKLQTRRWDDKNGVTRYTTEIVASHVQFLGGGKGDRQEQAPANLSEPGPFDDSSPNDDIPF